MHTNEAVKQSQKSLWNIIRERPEKQLMMDTEGLSRWSFISASATKREHFCFGVSRKCHAVIHLIYFPLAAEH